MQVLSALVAGFVFGIGLIISGMTNPAKVQNFLDVFGQWDPSLILVMGGAIAVAMPGFRWISNRGRPLFADSLQLPNRSDIDSQLLVGAAVFGVGWGLGGLCPGPALTNTLLGHQGIIVFLVTMFIGMRIARWASSQWRSSASTV